MKYIFKAIIILLLLFACKTSYDQNFIMQCNYNKVIGDSIEITKNRIAYNPRAESSDLLV